jgi:hypothetical protein
MTGKALVPVPPRKQGWQRAGPGRPSSYTEDAADEIFDRLCTGEPLAWICADDHMPATHTVYDWCKARPEFSARFERAREIGHDAIAASALADANNLEIGEERYVTIGADGVQRLVIKRGDMLGHRKLKVDTKLRLLEKWDARYRQAPAKQVELPESGSAPQITGGLPDEEP